MCSCEPSFTCSRCADTRHDPQYLLDADEPRDTAEVARDRWLFLLGVWTMMNGGAR